MSVVVVVVGMKIARSHVLGICVCCKYNQSVDISEKQVLCALKCSKGVITKLTTAINHAFSVQPACGLSTTPTLLACAEANVHAQAQYWKGLSSHKTALQ